MELRKRRGSVRDLAEDGDHERVVNRAIGEWEPSSAALNEANPARPGAGNPTPHFLKHLALDIETDKTTVVANEPQGLE